MGEKEYRIFLNDTNFCVCDHEVTAKEIINAMKGSTRARWLDESLNEGDGVYRP